MATVAATAVEATEAATAVGKAGAGRAATPEEGTAAVAKAEELAAETG